MNVKCISQPPKELLMAFRQSVKDLLYPSETDAVIVVQSISSDEVGAAFSAQDIRRLFYEDDEDATQPTDIDMAEMLRSDSNGTKAFFRNRLDFITSHTINEVEYKLPDERVNALKWRHLRDLLFDNLIRLRYFNVELAEPDQARKDIYIVGQQVEINIDLDTNEIQTKPLDWIVLSTYVIET
jgi:hypothetical protein